MEGIETSNAFDPLKLQSLGTTRGRNLSPGKELSPSKRVKKKPKWNAAVMAVPDEKLRQAEGLNSQEKRPGEVDANESLSGRMANAAVSLTGLPEQ